MSLSSLSTLLKQVDGTQMGIQRAASAMMKLYDHGSAGAVTEWRNTLQTCSVEQLLPLLYVCNEVLQTSKRNRGNKFLESYGTSLVSSLQYMASKLNHPEATENIRRVVKIWGDRQVFSIRFVNELLQGLEPYRKHTSAVAKQPPPPLPKPVVLEDAAKKKELASKTGVDTDGNKDDKDNRHDDDSDDDAIMEILEETNSKKRFGKQQSDEDNDDEEDDDDDDDIFGDDSQRSNLLNIEINNVVVQQDDGASNKKRGSMGSSSSGGDVKRRRKSGSSTSANETSIKLSMSHFMDLFHRLIQLHQTYEMAMLTIRRICGGTSSTTTGADTAPITIDHSDDTVTEDDSTEEQELQNLVGNELQDAKCKNDQDMKALGEQRVILYRTAVEQHTIEEMIRKQYLPWLDVALQQDHTDLQFCQSLLRTITKFRPLHTEIHTAYTARMEDDYKRQQLLYEQQRILKEKEENEKFRLAALSKETEAKPGMVWNPSTREYQALNTDESWRD